MRRLITKLRNREGMTLIELLMASAAFSILATAMLAGLSYIFRNQRRVREMTTEDRMVSSLIANIRANLSLYQTNFTPANSADANGKPYVDDILKDLPIAFSDDVFLPAKECASCPGRMGFVLQPYSNMPNLYKLTMRITHTELYGKGVVREYNFIASFK